MADNVVNGSKSVIRTPGAAIKNRMKSIMIGRCN